MAQDKKKITRFRVMNDHKQLQSDVIATEEPLQILLEQRKQSHPFSITMRTPGNDIELITGLLFCEGIIQSAKEIESFCSENSGSSEKTNIVTAKLSNKVIFDIDDQKRSYPSYSGCGFCGKTNLKSLELKPSRPLRKIKSILTNSLIRQLRQQLAQQDLFSNTGGSHVAGLIYEIDDQLNIENSPFFEDVGRHNALDKLIGYELDKNNLTQPGVLLLSGRIGFELVQKAVVAGFSIIVALGAPSSLAVQAAFQFNITLIGFAKDNCFNLYTTDGEPLSDIEHS